MAYVQRSVLDEKLVLADENDELAKSQFNYSSLSRALVLTSIGWHINDAIYPLFQAHALNAAGIPAKTQIAAVAEFKR